VEALTEKFAPENFFTVKERILKRATERKKEIQNLKNHSTQYNLYSVQVIQKPFASTSLSSSS
jgi:hypothetical protein